MTSNKNTETTGIIFILASALLWSMFPILINRGVQDIPPLSFAAFATLVGGCVAFFYTAWQKKLPELKDTRAYAPMFWLTIFIVVIPTVLLFLGTVRTNALNTSLLLLTEIIFTLLFTHFMGERTTREKLIGSLSILIGTGFILYRGTWQPNIGDLLIIASTALYPFGNLYAKRALLYVSSSTILLVRWLLGGIFLLLLSALYEGTSQWATVLSEHWQLIVFIGVLPYFICKVLWYEGLKRLDITKAVSLVMTSYFFSFIILLFMGISINLIQSIGIVIMTIGVIFSIKRKSVIYEHN